MYTNIFVLLQTVVQAHGTLMQLTLTTTNPQILILKELSPADSTAAPK